MEEKTFEVRRIGDWKFTNTLIKNTYKPWACVIELIDNATDAVMALPNTSEEKRIDIKYGKNKDGDFFTITDNGVGMTPKRLGEVLSDYMSHFPMRKNGISTVGIGLSCSLLGLSNMEDGTRICIETTTKDGVTSSVDLMVSNNRVHFEKFKIRTVEGDKNKTRGTSITLIGCENITQYTRQIKGYIEKIHPYTTSIIDIYLNGTKLDYSDKDKVGLHNFSEPIEDIKCGYYNINSRIYYVKDWNLIDSKDHTLVKNVKVIYSYIPVASSETREIKKTDGGAFASLGGRMLVCGGNFGKKKWTIGLSDRGGVGRASSCVIVTDDTKKIFEVSGNKVNGMTPYGENNNLVDTNRYYILGEKGKVLSFFQAHCDFEKHFNDMYHFETDGKKDETNRNINDEIAKKIINGVSIRELIREYDSEHVETNTSSEDDFIIACENTDETKNSFEVTSYFAVADGKLVVSKDYEEIVDEKTIKSICNAFGSVVDNEEVLANALNVFIKNMSV